MLNRSCCPAGVDGSISFHGQGLCDEDAFPICARRVALQSVRARPRVARRSGPLLLVFIRDQVQLEFLLRQEREFSGGADDSDEQPEATKETQLRRSRLPLRCAWGRLVLKAGIDEEACVPLLRV